LFHMNWALLGPKLDELKDVLHAPFISQTPLGLFSPYVLNILI